MRLRDLARQLFFAVALLCLPAAGARGATFFDWDYLGPEDLGSVEVGQPLSYQLSFTPNQPGEVNVLSARLGVVLVDSPSCDCGSAIQRYRCSLRDLLFEPEYALIETDGQWFAESDLMPPWVVGDVTPLIAGAGDTLDVKITALEGAFQARAAWLFVHYDVHYETLARQVPGSAIPEPTAALLFAAGLLFTTRRLRAH